MANGLAGRIFAAWLKGVMGQWRRWGEGDAMANKDLFFGVIINVVVFFFVCLFFFLVLLVASSVCVR